MLLSISFKNLFQNSQTFILKSTILIDFFSEDKNDQKSKDEKSKDAHKDKDNKKDDAKKEETKKLDDSKKETGGGFL